MGAEGAHNFSSKLSGSGFDHKDNQSSIGFKAGYDFDIFRVYGSYAYAFEAKDKGLKWHSHKFMINGDYTPTIANNLKLIAGGYTGISALSLEVNGYDESGSDMTIGLRLFSRLIFCISPVPFGYDYRS